MNRRIGGYLLGTVKAIFKGSTTHLSGPEEDWLHTKQQQY